MTTTSANRAALLVALLLATLVAWAAAVTPASAITCPNEAVRGEQGSTGLPDCRAYELVSPADKVGGTGVGYWSHYPAAAAHAGFPALEGDRFAVQGTYGSSLLADGLSYANSWAFAERTADGWKSHTPLTRPPVRDAEKRFARPASVSDDLSTLSWSDEAALLPIWQEQDFDTQALNVSDWHGRWEPIAPTAPEQATQPRWLHRADVSGDGRQVALSGFLYGLAGPGDPSLDQVHGRALYLDDVSAGLSNTFPGEGARTNIGVCTGAGEERTRIPVRLLDGTVSSQVCPPRLAGRSERLISPYGATLTAAFDGQLGGRAQSTDGDRIFFMSPDRFAGAVSGAGEETVPLAQVYVRNRSEDGEIATRWISRPENGLLGQQADSLMASVFLETITPDGDKALFSTASPLTADDPNGQLVAPPGGVTTGSADPDSADLYLYDLPPDPQADGSLIRISAGPTGAADPDVPSGLAGPGSQDSSARFVSDDGRRVYFTTSAPIPAVPTPSNGTITTPGGAPGETQQVNLYLYDAAAPLVERWRFIARLPADVGASDFDLKDCASSAATIPRPPFTSVEGTSPMAITQASCVQGNEDGSFITFFTPGRLTADDPDGDSYDVYGYDAASDQLTRLSAAQGTAEQTYACLASELLPFRCHADLGAQRYPVEVLSLGAAPQDPAARIAYFQSVSPLVPEDLDANHDVYRWRDGDLSLLTSGEAASKAAMYMGTDRAGDDVFIATRDRLTWEDHDSVLDVYSAHAGGGFPIPPAAPSCDVLADACQVQKGAVPPAATAGSGDFAGPGDPAAKKDCSSIRRKLAKAMQRLSRSRHKLKKKLRECREASR
jgi:hypothetical protein